MTEFRKYPPPPPLQTEPPMCSVTYPEPCRWVAEGEVWSLPFCEKHGREAAQAAGIEAYEDACRELQALLTNMDGERLVRNPLVRKALERVKLPEGSPERGHSEEVAAAYPLDEIPIDPDTLVFDYEDLELGDGPFDWWCEAQELTVKWMREAYEAGQPPLLKALEPIREYATVQRELASRDLERRWAAPRRAERERRRREEGDRPGGAA